MAAQASSTTAPSPASGGRLSAAFAELFSAGVSFAASKASKGVDKSVDKLEDVAEDGGSAQGGLLGGLGAALWGDNPLVGAIKGAWSEASNKTKLIVSVSLLLGVVVAPVVLLLLLLALLIAWAVSAIRSSGS